MINRKLTYFISAIMYIGRSFRLSGANRPPVDDDCDNLYAVRASIATLINASLASDNDDCWALSTAEIFIHFKFNLIIQNYNGKMQLTKSKYSIN